ncbi:hypothetical protein SAMN05444170_4593 [Bradyrhizobium erythrophlei]|jgi:hypothetical protein|uniref:Uncharacterized protein n=1 Tax=Bradyrhizobium erythrophlei TaxID=1437360 RepID=A0A1M7UDM7_9BRAD|nr:hypothetical protein SAMN05444170_4593 [Bradyrhizobium erythrophlei]
MKLREFITLVGKQLDAAAMSAFAVPRHPFKFTRRVPCLNP